MNKYILPNWIYKLMPVFYAGLGLYIWAYQHNPYALTSAVMLIGAGIIAQLMRKRSMVDSEPSQAAQPDLNPVKVCNQPEPEEPIDPPSLAGIYVAEASPDQLRGHTMSISPSQQRRQELAELEAEIDRLVTPSTRAGR